ncbi:hypothetical protein QWI17_22425 [Gilvimarinus sp. SDUM040013]|nr:hypothetical protein [Gilvimarinus sp. SDUM040013]MDO3388619.1 hypothetical protein [Gilvimarinus sp. SDUM040013]
MRLFVCIAPAYLGACSGGDDIDNIAGCGEPPPPQEYSISQYQVEAVVHDEALSDLTFGGGSVVGEQPVDWAHLGIELNTERDYFLVQHNAPQPSRFSLFGQAHACSFAGPQPAEKIIRVEVVSDNAYTDDYPAGTDLSALTSLYDRAYLDGVASLADYEYTPAPAREWIKFFFTEPPQYQRQRFTVTIELDSNNTFVVTTPEVYLVNE